LRAFARRGAATASADEIVHRLYGDPGVQAALRERWGERVFDRGQIDRRAIGELVFADAAELEWLEGLLHPRVVEEQARWRAELESRPDPPRVVVVEIPLLFETGGEARFDAVVVITAPEEVRAARTAVARAADRGRRLIPDDEKVRRADFAYVNDGSLEELDSFVSDVLAKLPA
jgi:dephospho-CoA kinase